MISQAELIKAIQTKTAKELFALFATFGEESTRPTAEDQIGEVLGRIANAIVEERENRLEDFDEEETMTNDSGWFFVTQGEIDLDDFDNHPTVEKVIEKFGMPYIVDVRSPSSEKRYLYHEFRDWLGGNDGGFGGVNTINRSYAVWSESEQSLLLTFYFSDKVPKRFLPLFEETQEDEHAS